MRSVCVRACVCDQYFRVLTPDFLFESAALLLLQWYMVTLVHVYNRWKNSEISCYVNGELASFGDIAWFVNTSDVSSSTSVRFPLLVDIGPPCHE